MIAQMRLEHEHWKQKVFKMDVDVEKREREKMNRKHLIGQVRMACRNTFERCVNMTTLKSKRERFEGGGEVSIEEQLDFIAGFFLDLKAIEKVHKDKKREEERLRQVQESNALKDAYN